MSWNPFHRCANLWCFLIFFCLCYFLETITFTYLVSAVQSIERQFQIPSRMSGSLVAATDIGYIVTVVVLAYFGSKSGNRARWIGAGCLLIAIACLIVAMPTFVFPTKLAVYNNKELTKDVFEPLTREQISTPDDLLNTMWGRQMPAFIRDHLLQNGGGSGSGGGERTGAAGAADWQPPRNFLRSLTPSNEPGDRPASDDSGSKRLPPSTGRNLVSGAGSVSVPGSRRRMARSPAADFGGADGDPEDDPLQRLQTEMKEVVTAHYFGVDSYAVFAEKMFNITNDAEILTIPQMIVRSASLPFGFCRNESMIVKRRMKEQQCKQQQGDGGNSAAFAIVFIGITLIGVGHSMPWTLGMPMIDDNVNKQKTPYYFAGVFFVRIMGPVAGFMLGAVCSKMYVDLKPPPAGITPLDPRWIGAWWLGFLVIFVVLTIPSLLLMCFPKFQTKESTKRETIANSAVDGNNATRTPVQIKIGDTPLIQQPQQQQHVQRQSSVLKELRGFGRSLAQILRCPVYTGCLIGRLFDAFAFKGYFTFKPKYLENHYGITQFKSSILMGVQGVVGYAGGIVLGSLLMRKAKLEGRKAAAYVGACSLISAILSFAQIFLGCHSVVNQIGRIGIETGNETNPTWPTCPGCDCTDAVLYPVCDRAGNPYYSPCHAGCSNFTYEQVGIEGNFYFNKCSAVNHELDQATRDWCQDDCNTPFIIYFVLGCVGGIVSGSAVIPGVLIVMRSVQKDYRSVALGFSGFIVSLISTFPSPPVYGLIIDTACSVWNTDCEGERGSCQIYDPNLLRQRIYIFHGALRFTALLFDIWVWYYAKDLKLMEDQEEKAERDKELTTDGDTARSALPFSPSFAHEIEDEVRGLQVEGSELMAKRLSM